MYQLPKVSHVCTEWVKQYHSQDRASPHRNTVAHTPDTMKTHTRQAPSDTTNTPTLDSGHKVPLNVTQHIHPNSDSQ